MTKQEHDNKCPRCGEMTFQKGTLLVGDDSGGPLRFEFDNATRIKVRSRACRACGFIDFWFNVQELIQQHQKIFTKRVESLCQRRIEEEISKAHMNPPHIRLTEGEFFLLLDEFPSEDQDEWNEDYCPIRIDLLKILAQEHIKSRPFETKYSRQAVTVRFDENSQRFIGKWTTPKQEDRHPRF